MVHEFHVNCDAVLDVGGTGEGSMAAALDGERAFQQTRELYGHGHLVCRGRLEDARRTLTGLLNGPKLVLEAAVAFASALRDSPAIAQRESITLDWV